MKSVTVKEIRDYLKDTGKPVSYENVRQAAEIIPLRNKPDKCSIIIRPDETPSIDIIHGGAIICAPTFEKACELYYQACDIFKKGAR